MSEPMIDRCPTCRARDVHPEHVVRCQETSGLVGQTDAVVREAGIPAVTGADLWAHLRSHSSPELATRLVEMVIDLGWRPVVGSDEGRLWQRPGRADVAS